MTETQTFTLPLDQFTEASMALLTYAQHRPTEFAVCSIAITAGVVTIVVPLAIGFAATGPVGGSVAAAWQASIGNVVAGSLFATLQSMTMTGTMVVVGGGLVAVGSVGLAGGAEWARGVDWAKSVDWTKGEHWAQWAEVAGLGGIVMEQWEAVAKGVEWAGQEARKRTEEGIKSVDWEGVAKGVEQAGQEVRKRTEEGIKSVDWEGVANGAEWVGQEARKRTEEGVRSVNWEGLGEGIMRAFTWR